MPIYEYRCRECGEEFEKLMCSMNSAPEAKRPECGGEKVERLLSVLGIQISGSTSEPVSSTCMARR